MSSVWDMILQWGSTLKVSIELPVATRHRRDMTEKLLKATFNPNTHTHTYNDPKFYNRQVWINSVDPDHGVSTVSHSVCILWTLLIIQLVKPHFFSNLSIFTTIFSDLCLNFSDFYGRTYGTSFRVCFWDVYFRKYTETPDCIFVDKMWDPWASIHACIFVSCK